MTSLVALVLTGLPLLFGGNMTAAAYPSHLLVANAVVFVADPASETTSDDFAAKRDEYMRKAQNVFRYWQERMSQWTAEAKEKGGEIGEQAQKDLDEAWSNLQADRQKLQDAAPGVWDKARASFHEASQRLKSAWQQIHHQG